MSLSLSLSLSKRKPIQEGVKKKKKDKNPSVGILSLLCSTLVAWWSAWRRRDMSVAPQFACGYSAGCQSCMNSAKSGLLGVSTL